MDVKQFFRKKLVAYVAALLSVGLCGLPRAYAADQNYQPDVSVGGTITGSKDIADYGHGLHVAVQLEYPQKPYEP